jgi:hypothetical protein
MRYVMQHMGYEIIYGIQSMRYKICDMRYEMWEVGEEI